MTDEIERIRKSLEGKYVSEETRATIEGVIEGIEGVIESILNKNQSLQKKNEKLATKLGQKDTALREIHHRVKNNFQVIASLLKLQSKDIKDEKYLSMFQESHNRIKLMRMIYERLYQSEDLESINIKEYITSLVTGLYYFYDVQDKIKLDLRKVSNVSLKPKKAIPYGLIINEIVTNSFKYAFPEGWQGEKKVGVSLSQMKEGTIKLVVYDTGKGIPPEIDPKTHTDSLGLKLVNSLTEQLDGEMSVDRSRGTKYSIMFQSNP